MKAEWLLLQIHFMGVGKDKHSFFKKNNNIYNNNSNINNKNNNSWA